ncbi:MAG: hypothetical protein AAFY29_09190 [Pseudomonadota bacterium]
MTHEQTIETQTALEGKWKGVQREGQLARHQGDRDLAGPQLFASAIEQAHKTMLLAPWLQYSDKPNLEQAHAELQLKHQIAAALDQGFALNDAKHPEFRRLDRHNQFGLVNPDNLYFLASIETPGTYIIHGKRGSAADLQVQLGAGEPGFNENLTSPLPVSELDLAMLKTKPNGEFRIIISETPPEGLGEGENWLRSTKGLRHANSVLIRESLMDWRAETGSIWRIERCDTVGEGKPLPGPETANQQYERAAQYLLGLTKGWVKFVDRLRTNLPANRMSPPRQTEQGLPGQFNAAGHFQLGKTNAFVLTVAESDARYQGIQVGDLWFNALDYRYHQTSLTTKQAYQSDDGNYRFIISRQDPGYENWLDPAGASTVFAFLRWQGLNCATQSLAPPLTESVQFKDLNELLKDEPRFTPAQRAKQLDERHQAALTMPRGF